MTKSDEQLSDQEVKERSEAALKRLLKMPPEPRGKPPGSGGLAKKRGRPAKPKDRPSS